MRMKNKYQSEDNIIWSNAKSGREIAPNTGTNVTKFFTLATKSWKLVA